MTYNSKVYTEQGGSVQRVTEGGSLVVHEQAAFSVGGRRFYTGTGVPTLEANAGDLFLRGGSDAGGDAGLYVNVSDGANGGSVWASASLNLP